MNKLNCKKLFAALCCGVALAMPGGVSASPAPVEYSNYPANYHQTTDPLHQHLLGAIDYSLWTEGPKYSVYVSYPKLKGNRPLIWNNTSRPAASLIKLFIMEHALDLAEKGKLDLNKKIVITEKDMMPDVADDSCGPICRTTPGTVFTVEDLIRLMITESDNSAANLVIDLCGGIDKVNRYIAAHGYTETKLRYYLMRGVPQLAPFDTSLNNVSSVRDLGLFFERLYEGVRNNEAKAVRMNNILLLQTDTTVFTDALPQFITAHKTGELDDCYIDAGIIYSDKGPVILCILNDEMTMSEKNRDLMRQMAANCYQTLLLCKKGLIVPQKN